MPVKFKIKVVQVGNSLKVTIPKEMVEHVGLEKGETIEMWADDGRIIIEKGSKTPERTRK
jgi:antitoxin component of MazEF toxin-antitoxin module